MSLSQSGSKRSDSPSMTTTVYADTDFLPVSKFSKYHSHLVCSNEHFIVYTPSKRGIVRVIFQEDGSHIALELNTHVTISSLHMWETENSSSLLAAANEEGSIYVWELYYYGSASWGKAYLRKTYDFYVDVRFICRSIPGTRYFAYAEGNTIYIELIPERPNARTPDGTPASIYIESNIEDYCFHPDKKSFAILSSKGITLHEITIEALLLNDSSSLDDDEISNGFTSAFPNASNIWYLANSEYKGSKPQLLVKSSTDKTFGVLVYPNTVLTQFDYGSLVPDSESDETYYDDKTFYDPQSNSILMASLSHGSPIYFLVLSDLKRNVTGPLLSHVRKVVPPADFHPLGFSISKNLDKKTERQMIDLFIFHTKGLSILPVDLSNGQRPTSSKSKSKGTKAQNESPAPTLKNYSQPPTLKNESLAPSLKAAVHDRLTQYKNSSKFPRNISNETVEAFEHLLVQSGVLNTLADHFETIISSKVDSRLQELERSLSDKSQTGPPSSGDAPTLVSPASQEPCATGSVQTPESISPEIESENCVSSEEEAETAQPNSGSTGTPQDSLESISRNAESSSSLTPKLPSERVPIESSVSMRMEARELSPQEYVLLSAISNYDLSGAVRLATTNVGNVSMTRVLDTYVAGSSAVGPDRESKLVDTLLSGDALVLLSFIAVLSSDISKNDGPAALASCLNWLHKLIVLINDNFARYKAYEALIHQVYSRTINILATIPQGNVTPAATSLIQELNRIS